ncbi:small ribosomal subunit protein uS12m [Palaemon carinicauda]|uniref:small ribosomal subunit protein uS12m n=1 Tax=Palaemon carinicauda TaxID=392227 RepID=UPI0035B5C2A8
MLGLRALRSAFSKLNVVASSPAVVDGATKKAITSKVRLLQRPPSAICQASTTCRTLASWSLGSSRWSSDPLGPVATGSLETHSPGTATGLLSASSWNHLGSVQCFSTTGARCASLYQMHRRGPVIKKRPNRNPLIKSPMARGVVLKTLIKKPRKPNSANRKCVLVRLPSGKELVAYVPGEGHNLQEHNIVMVRVGRLRDVPGVKVKCIRGKYDLPHVVKRKT